MSSYAAPSDLVARYDVRTVGNLCSDNGVVVSPANLATDPNLLAVLADASGEIDAALLQGQRYTTADLAGLTGNSLAYLKRLACKIAMGLLWERRPYLEDDNKDAALKAARDSLEKLRKGENIFDVTAVKDAGVPSIVTPSVSSVTALNLMVDGARGSNGFYPPRRFPGVSS